MSQLSLRRRADTERYPLTPIDNDNDDPSSVDSDDHDVTEDDGDDLDDDEHSGWSKYGTSLSSTATKGCVVLEPISMAPCVPDENFKIDETDLEAGANSSVYSHVTGKIHSKCFACFKNERARAEAGIGQLRVLQNSANTMLDSFKTYIVSSQKSTGRVTEASKKSCCADNRK